MTRDERALGITLACVAFTGCSVLTGCSGAVDPAPFEDYATATRELGEGMAAVFAVDHDWTREVFVDRLAAGDVDSLELVVRFPDDPDSFTVALPLPPVHLVVADAALRMSRLTDGVVRYAELLEALATGDIATDADVRARAAGLNAAATDLADGLDALGVDVPATFEARASIVSAVTADAFATYVRDRRREALGVALEANQATVDAWVTLSLQALEMVRDGVQAGYGARKRVLVRALTDGTLSQRTRAAEGLADLQAAVVDVTRTLEELRAGYAAMPAAHRDLAAALEADRPALSALAELYGHARRVALAAGALEAARGAGRTSRTPGDPPGDGRTPDGTAPARGDAIGDAP
jgi:hypothetical protein